MPRMLLGLLKRSEPGSRNRSLIISSHLAGHGLLITIGRTKPVSQPLNLTLNLQADFEWPNYAESNEIMQNQSSYSDPRIETGGKKCAR